MKFSLRKTTGLQWVGFYLTSLAALALLGWSEGALWLAAISGGVALAVYWVAGLGWAATANPRSDDDFINDPAYSFLLCNVYHSDDA